MPQSDIDEFVRKAETLYDTKLKALLEPEHLHEFVAIEPETGDYFLGKTLGEATRAARKSHPNRLTHAMWIGHRAALHFGMHVQ